MCLGFVRRNDVLARTINFVTAAALGWRTCCQKYLKVTKNNRTLSRERPESQRCNGSDRTVRLSDYRVQSRRRAIKWWLFFLAGSFQRFDANIDGNNLRLPETVAALTVPRNRYLRTQRHRPLAKRNLLCCVECFWRVYINKHPWLILSKVFLGYFWKKIVRGTTCSYSEKFSC